MIERALALAVLLPFVAHAELPQSSKWSWSVVSGGGISGRFLLFMESDKPAPRKAREWWTVETGARDADGKTPLTLTVRTASSQQKTTFTTWTENGVAMFVDAERAQARELVTRAVPPRVLSMERVWCASPLLGPFEGTCAGRAGGPLHQPELPLVVVVNAETGRTKDTLAALAIGVLSGMVVLPGHNDTSVVARMDSPPAPRLERSLETWRKSAHTLAALEKLRLGSQVDAESLGALLVLAGSPSLELVTALVQRAPELDRWPLLRLARQTGVDDAALTRVVARLAAADALHAATTDEARALQASALKSVEARWLSGIEGVLSGSMPTLRAVASGAEALDAAALRALKTAPLAEGEGAALAVLLPQAVLQKSLPDFIERLSDDEGLAVIARESPDAALASLRRVPSWVDRVLRGPRAEALLHTLSFDAPRVKLLDDVLLRAKPHELPTLLVTGMKAMTFDGGRLELLRKWKATTQLTPSQRLEVLELLRSDAERSEGARLLLAETAGEERRALLLTWLRRTSNADRRLEVLQSEAPQLELVEARELYETFTFGDAKRRVAPVLLSLVPEASRSELFVDLVAQMPFDDGKLELLKLPQAPKLTQAQQARVLKAFAFHAEKARALLK